MQDFFKVKWINYCDKTLIKKYIYTKNKNIFKMYHTKSVGTEDNLFMVKIVEQAINYTSWRIKPQTTHHCKLWQLGSHFPTWQHHFDHGILV